MSDSHVFFKAFRPSQMAGRDEMDEDSQMEKETKMAQYEVRAQAGLPLFEGSLGSTSTQIHKKIR
jgi:hypothetical protein